MKDNFEIQIPVSKEQRQLMQKMITEIRKTEIKAVSFKLSGTLINLPFSEQEDLFLLMEQDFKKFYSGKKKFPEIRINAEQKYDNLNNIYDLIMKQTKISAKSRDLLMNLECRLFIDSVFPRNFGKNLFNTAKSEKKKIIIVADTVYPRNVIVNVLNRCGYKYDELIITNESDNGNIYDTIIEKASVSNDKLLHIGGNIENDVEIPIMNGSKSLLLADTVPLMVKSGKLRGFIQAKYLYNYDSIDLFALHCAFGLYSAYMFDIPQNKIYQSDFCGNPYLLGFIVFGTLKLVKDYKPTEIQKKLISAAEKNAEISRGANDFIMLFSRHFGKISQNFGYMGCTLPIEFLEKYSASLDKSLMKKQLDSETFDNWENISEEPKIVPVYSRKIKQNTVSRLADKMFPPGTRVRNIVDGILVKLKEKARL